MGLPPGVIWDERGRECGCSHGLEDHTHKSRNSAASALVAVVAGTITVVNRPVFRRGVSLDFS